MSVDLKILTPDASINDSALLFGADSQASASPSVYTVSTLKTHILSSGFSDGSEAAPSITNTDDLNTGLFFPADNTIAASTDGSERMRIDSAGNVGIGTTSPSQKLEVFATNSSAFYGQVDDTVGDQDNYGIYLDYNGSGSDTLTTNRNHWGMYIDMDITATGGDATNEYRVYGQYIDLITSVPTDLIYGGFSNVRAAHDSGSITNIASLFNWVSLQNTGSVSNMWGLRNQAYVNFTGSQTLSNGYASSNLFYHGASLTGTTGSAYGSLNKIEINSGTINNAFPCRSTIDYNGGTIGTGYLYYGDYQGSSGTKWGIYLTGEDKSYFSGDVGIGTTAPTEKLDVNSDAIRIRTSQTPASATAAGTQGSICWDADYIYVCTATNTWKRATLATW